MADTFKEEQQKFPRVREAYQTKSAIVKSLLENKNIKINQVKVYLRAFKKEDIVEIWAKNISDGQYTLVKEYEVCQKSGASGPKRKQGDYQVPEGFYHIDRFNPYSNFYLSLGINYPNTSDRILGDENNLGGDIFIHGSCVTIGCLPMTDDIIKEIYILCVEAKNNGQDKIPVTIFPSKMDSEEYQELRTEFKNKTEVLELWDDLKVAFDSFNQSHIIPTIKFLNNGRHQIN